MLLFLISLLIPSSLAQSLLDSQGEIFPVSDWYYMTLTSAQPDDSCEDEDNPSADILENLSSKLHVPQNSFFITSLDSLSAGIISTNLSLLHPLPGLHTSLSNLQLTSPDFSICGEQFSLSLLLHEHSHLVHRQEVRNNPEETFPGKLKTLDLFTIMIYD